MRSYPEDWRKMPLAKDFVLGEFYVSASHPELAGQMHPAHEEISKLYLLCKYVLQPVRDELGPVRITSGVRRKNLNKLIGGVQTSQHLYAEAADIRVGDPKASFHYIVEDLKWEGEVICYVSRGFTHVSLPSPFVKPSRMVRP